MNVDLRFVLLSIFFINCLITASAQTAGYPEVTAIESKAGRIESNKSAIEKIKTAMISLEAEWNNKLKKLKDELDALYKDRDNLIRDMKLGYKCSQCGRYKSEFEKKGENFEKHLGDVKGYAIPESTAKIESVREDYKLKIAYKKVQIQNLEKGDDNLIKKRNEISRLQNENDQLCQQITGHSKSYENKVKSEVKGKHNEWVQVLMDYVSNILIEDDRITIYKARINTFEKEFQKKSEEVREHIKSVNLAKQNSLNSKITENGKKADRLRLQYDNQADSLQSIATGLKQQIEELNSQIKAGNFSDSAKAVLIDNKKQLEDKVIRLENIVTEYKNILDRKLALLESENKNYRDEVWKLTVSLSGQQDSAVAKMRLSYDKRINDAKLSITNATGALSQARKAYSGKAAFYNKSNDNYYNVVSSETDRMIIAGKKVSCSVWNNGRGIVMTSWNQLFPCVNTITTMAKPYSTHVFGSYCPAASSSSWLSAYKSFLSTLDDSDRQAVKANSNADWFDALTR